MKKGKGKIEKIYSFIFCQDCGIAWSGTRGIYIANFLKDHKGHKIVKKPYDSTD